MICKEKYFSNHSVKQMFSRSILKTEAGEVIVKGEIIKEYIDDKPYPSYLLLGIVNGKPLHVLIAKDEFGNCIIITVYKPNAGIWHTDFKTKIK